LDEDHVKEFEHQRKHHNVTMAEFYGYRLQHRNINGIALFRGGRLRQQFIMDAYVVVEQNRLRYLCLNQKKIRVDLYQGLQEPLLQAIIMLLPSDKRSFRHLLSQEVHVTWFKIIKMPWQSSNGPVARMRLLHSLAIPNGLRSRECCCLYSNLKIDKIW
jgi:hypothetical protein